MKTTMDQVRSVVAKIYSLQFYGDQTKTASEVTQVKSQLISFLKKANDLSRDDLAHLQSVVEMVEESFFNVSFLVLSGVDFDVLTKRQFERMLIEDEGKKFLNLMAQFDLFDRLFLGTGIADPDEQMKQATKLFRVSRRKFSLKSLIRGLDRSQLTVGGMPVQEFLVNTVIDVVTGDVHAKTGDDFLYSLGLVNLRKLKGTQSLLARAFTESINNYEKRASLTEEEYGTKEGNWTTFSAKFVGKIANMKTRIKDFTLTKMREGSGVSVPGNALTEENWNKIYESITELNFDEGSTEEFLDEYRDRGLDSKKLRELAKTLIGKLGSGTLNDEDVPMIMGVSFTREINDSPAKGAELIRYALENMDKVSSSLSVQSEMRTVAYQRLFQLGRLTKRELGFLDTKSLSGDVESHALRVELKKRLKLKDLSALFTAFKDTGNTLVKNERGKWVLVNENKNPFFEYEADIAKDVVKAERSLESMSTNISDKAGIGAYKVVEEYSKFCEIVEKHTELALERYIQELSGAGRKKNQELIGELKGLDPKDIIVSVDDKGYTLDLSFMIAVKAHLDALLAKKTISDHPLSSLSSTEYIPAVEEGMGAATQFAGNVTNTDMNRFSQLRRALLQSDQYKDDMKELEGIRIYIQKISQALSASITFPFEKKSGKYNVKKADQNLDAIKAFLGDLGNDIQRIKQENSRFLKRIREVIGNTERLDLGVLDDKGLDGFFEAIQKATDLYDEIKDVEASNLPSDFEAKVNEALNDVISEYNKFSGEFPQNYRDAVGLIVESFSGGQFNDEFKKIKAQIVRKALINKLAPRTRRGSMRYPSEKRAIRAKRFGKTMEMNTTAIIESVMGVDSKGPVKSEKDISDDISKARKKWKKEVSGLELTVVAEIEKLLEEGDFLVSDARLAKAIASLKKADQNKIKKAFTALRNAIAADVLTDYAERARLRAKIEVDEKIDELSKELETLKSNLTTKRNRTEAENQTLADINAGNHENQEKIAKLSRGRNSSGTKAAQSVRENRNENEQSRYSIGVDEIQRETDLDVTVKKSKVRKAEDRLRKNVQKMNENMASLPSIGGSNTNLRVLSDITMASILSNGNIRKKVGGALVDTDFEEVIDFAFGQALSDCFPTLRENSSALIKRFKGFMKAFGTTRRFFDLKSGSPYSPSIENIFGDASASSISDYAGDFLKFYQLALSKDVMEYVYTNGISTTPDADGYYNLSYSAGHFDIYEALGIGEEVMDRMEAIRNPENEDGDLTGISPQVDKALIALRDQLRDEVLNLEDFVPSDRLQKAVRIESTPANGAPLTLDDLSFPNTGSSTKPKEDLIQITKSFIHGTMLLGGLYVNKADDDLALSLGIDPDCLEDFAKIIGLKEKDQNKEEEKEKEKEFMYV